MPAINSLNGGFNTLMMTTVLILNFKSLFFFFKYSILLVLKKKTSERPKNYSRVIIFFLRETDTESFRGCYKNIPVVRSSAVLSWEEDTKPYNTFGKRRIFLKETALVRLGIIFCLYFFYSVFVISFMSFQFCNCSTR